MQLISLKLKGFGSFAREESLDFSAMNGLWLITGDTGAGKTTLFDAITFALYGATSGTSRVTGKTSMGLRSDFLSDSEEAYVELVFLQNGQRWTVRRTPAWKKEGNKNATVETVTLRSERESYEKTAVDTRIKELLRMDLDQFRQLVMIAQNDFEKLVLEADQREAILRKLLNTKRFERFQQMIKDEKNNADTEQKNTLAALQKEARLFTWDEQSLSEESVRLFQLHRMQPDVQVTDQLIDEMHAQQQRAASEISDEEQKQQPFLRQKSELEQQHGAAEQLHRRFDALDRARALVKQEDADAPAKQAEKQELERRSDALSVQPLLNARNAAWQDAQLKERQLTEAGQALEKAETALRKAEDAAKGIPTLEDQQKKAEAQASSLKEKLPLFTRLEDKQNELGQAKADFDAADRTLKEHQQKISNISEQLGALKETAAKLPEYAERASELKQQMEKAAQLVAALEALQQDEEKHVRDQAALRALLDAENAAWESYQLIHERFLSNEYAVVVKELKPGCACPICGSREHPQPYDPAPASGKAVTAREDSTA